MQFQGLVGGEPFLVALDVGLVIDVEVARLRTDDGSGKTLATASTTEKSLGVKTGGNIDAAKAVGKAIAERAQQAGVSSVVFDRGGYVYHGRVKALIDATREAGLNKHEASGAAESEETTNNE